MDRTLIGRAPKKVLSPRSIPWVMGFTKNKGCPPDRRTDGPDDGLMTNLLDWRQGTSRYRGVQV